MILTPQQQRDWDAHTIATEPISSIDLMERASKRWLEHARPFLKKRSITIFAGFGNNGGDALAVARLLVIEGYDVEVFLCFFGKIPSEEAQTNLRRLLDMGIIPIELQSDKDLGVLNIRPGGLLIDGIFGTGLRSGLNGSYARLVEKINTSYSTVLSIDIPSGLLPNALNSENDQVIKATHTISFQAMKLSFLMPESATYIGTFEIIDIGLHSAYLKEITLSNFLLDLALLSPMLLPREKFSHKGSYGHAVIVQGIEAMAGASILASKAAICSGAGLTTLLSDKKGINLSYPEVMVSSLEAIENFDKRTFCIGPGLGTDSPSRNKLLAVIKSSKNPLVLDADALNILSKEPKLLELIPAQSILTPHPKELARLIGPTANSFEQLEKARAFAQSHNVVMLIKRAHTVILGNDGRAYFNSTGNNGLAKGGSGDVLSGVICSLLAQGYTSLTSALIGVYVHGLAADLALLRNAQSSMTPQTIISYLSPALKRLGI